MDKYGHIHEDEYHVPGPTERMMNDMFADWDKQEANRNEKWKKWDILHEKKAKNNALLGMSLGFFGMVFNYITAVNAFSALDLSYADNANFFIGVSAVGFAAFAGYIAHTLITSTFDWFEARKKLKELGG